jgi:hypothetical protein
MGSNAKNSKQSQLISKAWRYWYYYSKKGVWSVWGPDTIALLSIAIVIGLVGLFSHLVNSGI